jgi:hypothetical protein
MRLACGVAALVLAAWEVPAHAGRSHFGWLYGSEIIPERGSELETWIVEENKKGDTKIDETSFWWGPVVALTAHVELAIPIEAGRFDDHVAPASTEFTRWGAEVRWRPQSPDKVDAGPLTNLVRLGVKRLIDERAGVRLEADVVTSYEKGPVFASVDLGAVMERAPGANEAELRPAAGVSVRVAGDLRVGGEVYSELLVDGTGTSWLVVGPTISLTRGRFWGAATYGIGVFGLRDAPRLTFGLAL